MTDRPRATIHYTPNGIPTHVTGGGTTRTRLTARQKRRLLRTAQRVWARATITWEPDTYHRDTVHWARVNGWARGRIVWSYDGGWTGRSDYTGVLRADGTLAGAKGRVESAIRRALGAA